ncbi:MAG: TetR/AcrR family transcriptional regulator [Moraxella sp.]|nr:TetR/AcrR family transcriptional regulator [Moraxella sp.]
MATRQEQFKRREEEILMTAERLLLESLDGDLTLDALAAQLDVAKGTLYKHFDSKDELLLKILIRHEEWLFVMNRIDDGAAAAIARIVLQALMYPNQSALYTRLEERLASVAGLNRTFASLYQIRRERMARLSQIAEQYLSEAASEMSVESYLVSLWSLGQGGANLLNSSFYQRYIGKRDALSLTLVEQALLLPYLHVKASSAKATTTDTADTVATPTKNSIHPSVELPIL